MISKLRQLLQPILIAATALSLAVVIFAIFKSRASHIAPTTARITITPADSVFVNGVNAGVRKKTPYEWEDTLKTSQYFAHSGRIAYAVTPISSAKLLVSGGAIFQTDHYRPEPPENFLYDLKSGNGELVGAMCFPRYDHDAVVLKDGRVLITGGTSLPHRDFERRAEIWDPKTKKFSPAGSILQARSNHNSVLLKDGTVLLAGGVGHRFHLLLPPLAQVTECEVFDPAYNQSRTVGHMSKAWMGPDLFLLPDGDVLIFAVTHNIDDYHRPVTRNCIGTADLYHPDL